MRTLARTAVALGFVGAIAIGTTVPVMAEGVYLNAPGVHVGVGNITIPVSGVFPCAFALR